MNRIGWTKPSAAGSLPNLGEPHRRQPRTSEDGADAVFLFKQEKAKGDAVRFACGPATFLVARSAR